MNYGIPYMGSKSDMLHKISRLLPRADNFYDLFGGGFSVTHYVMLHRKNEYKRFYFNELESSTVQLIKDAIAGKYNYKVFKPKWISREDFNKNKEKCAYTRIVWSFGNNQKDYLFAEEIEEYKRSLHQAVIFDEFNDLAAKAIGVSHFSADWSVKKKSRFIRHRVAERAGELQQLQRLERLQQLQRLELTSLSYEEVEIKPDSVVYCDPPYSGTAKYTRDFDSDRFWDWVRAQKSPVYISEYSAPKDIQVIAAFRRKAKLSGRTDSVEKLYGNQAAVLALKTDKMKKKAAKIETGGSIEAV